MFDHLEFSVSDIAAARLFYGSICVAIGGAEMFFDESGKELGLGQRGIVQLLLTGGQPVQPTMHICFRANSKDAVQAAYSAAVAAGGTCNGPPGYRDHYGSGYYAAFIYDADGHNVEILFREPV